MDWRGLEPEFPGRFQPGVIGQNNPILIHNNRLTSAELLDRGRNSGHRLRIISRVARMGNDLLKRQVDHIHNFFLEDHRADHHQKMSREDDTA